MTRFRFRLRFCKRDDLRWISHHDLVRTVERWLRRAGLPLRRSEGFHPKPKLSFSSALALGIAALEEVMEFELTEPVEGDNFNKTYMDEHGEGANHVAYIVDNLDKEVAELKARGVPVMYHASGIYAYLDTRKVGGVVIELMQKRDMPPGPPKK